MRRTIFLQLYIYNCAINFFYNCTNLIVWNHFQITFSPMCSGLWTQYRLFVDHYTKSHDHFRNKFERVIPKWITLSWASLFLFVHVYICCIGFPLIFYNSYIIDWHLLCLIFGLEVHRIGASYKYNVVHVLRQTVH